MQARDFANVIALADRGMPQAVEVEEEILGALLMDPQAITRVQDLKPEHFYYSNNRVIFEAVQRVVAEDLPVDLMTVAEELLKTGELEKIGGQGRLADLTEFVISAVNIDYHATIVIERAKRRSLIEIANDVSRQARDLNTPLASIQSQLEERVYALSQASETKGAVMIGELLNEESDALVQRYEDRQNGVVGGDVIPTMFYDIDAMTGGGFRPGELIIIAGRPAMGKTSFVLDVATNYAATGQTSLFFSLEMTGRQLSRRMWSRAAKVPSGRIGSGDIYTQEWETLGHRLSVLSDLPLYVDDNSDTSVSLMSSIAMALRGKEGGLGGVFIDYLQLMSGDGGNRVEEISRLTRGLKLMAKRLDCPVFVLSQLSRNVESRTNKRPLMSDLRDSGTIEQDADIVLMLYRDEYYNPDTPDRGVAEVIFAKHRNGPVGTVRLLFEKEFTTFKNLAQ